MNSLARFPRTVAPFMAAGAILALPAAANAADVEPVLHAGNPSCADLGYTHELKFDPPQAGSDSADGVTIQLALGSDAFGTLVDWTSSSPIDAVIVKGGPDANAYVYAGESSGDTGLHTPFNGVEKYYGLSHVSFCWDDQTPDTPDTPDDPPADQPPADQPPADQPPAVQPPVVTPPQDGDVQDDVVKAGASKLSGPSGCAGRTVKASVQGTEIAQIVFRLDGRKVKTTQGAGSYSVKTSQIGVGVHRIKAKVTYTAASGTRPRTHTLTFQRCAAKKIAPRFAG